MESSTSNTQVMKPLFLKAGIPLALSIAGFVCARIISRRTIISDEPAKVCPPEANNDSDKEIRDDQESYLHGLDSLITSPTKDDDEVATINSNALSSIQSSDISFKEEIIGLQCRIEELQKRELDLEMKFLRYHVMKEQELVLMELKNMLVLEAAHMEFLDREISSIEAEKERFQNILADYFRVVEQIELVKLENRLLRRKAKRLSKKRFEQSRIIRETNLKIEAAEAEILSSCNALETSSNVIKNLENNVKELQTVVKQLQEEKNGLLIKLKDTENAALYTSKINAEGVTMEDYNKLVSELEQLRKDRASEIAELIYLRWTNACLRHELMRIHEQEKKIDEKKEHSALELEASHEETTDFGLYHQKDSSVLTKKGACIDVGSSSHDHQGSSRRKKLLHKLKRWVEGSSEINLKSKLEEKEKQEISCFRRHSVSEGTEEDYIIHARWSSSSA